MPQKNTPGPSSEGLTLNLSPVQQGSLCPVQGLMFVK